MMPVKEPEIYLTEPDAERLALLSNYVRSATDARHLAELEDKLAQALVMEPENIPPDVVTMNSTVKTTNLRTGNVEIFTLVFPSGANARKNRISVLGSLGRALLGARVGDVINYLSFSGAERRRVDEVLYQPEAHGDYHA
jgi:regulator of nucleoside diphosphate kinase